MGTRKLATLMFTDMVGYSALVSRDERLAFRLVEQHRGIVRRELRRYGGREVETIGDAFLIEFSAALPAAQCAIAIHQQLARHSAQAPNDPVMQLRIALHLGDVERPGRRLYGDAVNIAARLQELAPHGGIALSGPLLDQIGKHLPLPYRALGRPPLKNITDPPLVYLVEAVAVMAAVLPPPSLTRLQQWLPPRTQAAALATGLLLIAALGFYALPHALAPLASTAPQAMEANRPAAELKTEARSLAVLPFENRGGKTEDAYFSDGVQDEILTRLAKVAALRVVSSASTASYGPNPSDLDKVAAELGVRSLLRGSVQRSGKLVRVHVQLIDVASRSTRWAETYDRSLSESLTVQSEVATAIAGALNAELTPTESVALAEVPTTSTDAYDAYLHGRAYQTRAEISPEKFRAAIRHYRDAVRLDPDFALAWARLAFAHGALYWFGYDHTPERKAQAEHAAAEAVRLQPELGESFLALGQVRYFANHDYPGALAAFEQARQRIPNDPDVLMATSYVKRRQGRLDEAVSLQREAALRDPRNTSLLQQFAISLILSRSGYAEALQVLERALHITPDDSSLIAAKVSIEQAQGNLTAAAAVLRTAPQKPDDWFLFRKRISQWLYEGNYQPAIAALQAALAQAPPDRGATIGPYYVQLVLAQTRAGQNVEARTSAMKGITLLGDLRRHGFDTPLLAAAMAQLHALIGEADAARKETDLAQKGFADDAVFGPYGSELRARVETQLGNADGAFAALPPLLTQIYSSDEYLTGLTPALLKMDPTWQALRSDPRFIKLLAVRNI